MKKHLSLVVAAFLAVFAFAKMATSSPINEFVNFPAGYGSSMLMINHSVVGLGRYPGSNACLSIPFTTDVNLTYGQPVVITSSTTNGISVSGTSTLGDTKVIGFAVFPSPYSYTCNTCTASGSVVYTAPAAAGGVTTVVQVAVQGVILAQTGVNVTKGDILINSGTAGLLTESSAATATAMDLTNTSAAVAIALQTVSQVASGTANLNVPVLILK